MSDAAAASAAAAAASPESPAKVPLTVAAVDLGSNSFHMVIGTFVGDDVRVVDRMREPVRLAEGLGESGQLSSDAEARALACLERFGQRIRELPRDRVRIVGTNTFRRARQIRAFSLRAREILGHPIEVISGEEEARLIYSGVAHTHALDTMHRLVVDVGGGSTEVIVGEAYEVLRAHSLYMGCVTFSQRFFPAGKLSRAAFREAEIEAGLELRAIELPLRGMGWDACVGASGTIGAIHEIARLAGWAETDLTLPALKQLRRTLIEAGDVAALSLPGLRADRAAVLPGGLAIVIALFKGLAIESMSASSGALREGVLYDLVGRIRHEDARDATIRRLVDQYHVDLAQATRVERTAVGLLRQLQGPWGLEPARARQLLAWAARLHEVGLAIAYTGHHKHGAYLLQHSHMPGFSADDQHLLAELVGGHRRGLKPTTSPDRTPRVTSEVDPRLTAILRLAVLLNRSRVTEPTPLVEVDGALVKLTFPAGWLADHPLTAADLARETAYARAIGLELSATEAAGRA